MTKDESKDEEIRYAYDVVDSRDPAPDVVECHLFRDCEAIGLAYADIVSLGFVGWEDICRGFSGCVCCCSPELLNYAKIAWKTCLLVGSDVVRPWKWWGPNMNTRYFELNG